LEKILSTSEVGPILTFIAPSPLILPIIIDTAENRDYPSLCILIEKITWTFMYNLCR